jgi:hypothetical protein
LRRATKLDLDQRAKRGFAVVDIYPLPGEADGCVLIRNPMPKAVGTAFEPSRTIGLYGWQQHLRLAPGFKAPIIPALHKPRARWGHMRRRDFIALIGAGAAFPLVAWAQSSGKTWRIGFIAHRNEKFYDPLFQGLRELGYVEGQNLVVERRYAEGHVERFAEFADEMVRLKVEAPRTLRAPLLRLPDNIPTSLSSCRTRSPSSTDKRSSASLCGNGCRACLSGRNGWKRAV